ncbi:copper chaperone CopZ [Amphibacillus indicireducens]|uniref:Copper chaperone CopZ n=1 Tax=Amphibacillus indicireducens TaxID=1076330 RepID=A0ABP7VWB2_9BACI
MKKIKLKVTGMSCNNCLNHVETALAELEGVEKVKVNLKKGIANVKFDETIQQVDDLIKAVDQAGYQAELA